MVGVLSNKVALVTGASRGIGRAIALRFAREGAAVAVNYSASAAKAEQVVDEIRRAGGTAEAFRADVAKPQEIVAMFEAIVARFKRLNVVVSNAGIEHFGPIGEVTQDAFDRVFNVNTRGQLFVMQQAARYLGKGDAIMAMSSISAAKGYPHHAIYSGSKAAVEGFVRCLAAELGPKGITVNVIAPGGTKSDMYEANAVHYTRPGSSESVDEQIAKMSPLNRVATPEDIANTAVFLASPQGDWYTGQVLRPCGGFI